MKANALGVIAFSLILAACNSQPDKSDATPVETAPTTQSTITPAPADMQPAPEGLPSRIATEVITASGQPCASVAKADRDAGNGTILATCEGGETYRVYTEAGKGPAALAL